MLTQSLFESSPQTELQLIASVQSVFEFDFQFKCFKFNQFEIKDMIPNWFIPHVPSPSENLFAIFIRFANKISSHSHTLTNDKLQIETGNFFAWNKIWSLNYPNARHLEPNSRNQMILSVEYECTEVSSGCAIVNVLIIS